MYLLFFECNFFVFLQSTNVRLFSKFTKRPPMKFRSKTLRTAALMALSFILCARLSAQTDKLGLNTIVIDPGHGGKDPGCVSADKKTYEKSLTLKISNLLSEKIKAGYPSVNVLMTRTKDSEFIPLNDRAKYATRNNADFFISIHINASSGSKSTNGYSIHLLGQSTDKTKDTYAFNMDVCKRENEVILLEEDYSTNYQGFDPNDPESDIFLRLMHNAYREQSLLFGQIVNDKLKDGPFKKSNGIYQNNFAVLRLASMPAMLIELGFISNAGDLAILRSDESIERIAQLLYEAFCEYKTLYDESVGAGQGSAAVQENETVAQEAPVSDELYYGTQVLVTAKEMKKDDKFFLGYEWRRVKSGNFYKYIIGVSADPDEARKIASEIRKTYPDAFCVKVENGVSTALKQGLK